MLLPGMTDVIRSLFQQSAIGQSRSSVLNPLQWLVALLLAATVSAAIFGTVLWFLILLSVLTTCGVVVTLGFYAYFARGNPDSLRSEHYSLSKMAIEKGLLGDNLTGLVIEGDTVNEPAQQLLPGETQDERRS